MMTPVQTTHCRTTAPENPRVERLCVRASVFVDPISLAIVALIFAEGSVLVGAADLAVDVFFAMIPPGPMWVFP